MMMREQQWDRSNCRHFRIDVCLHQRIYMRAFVNARNKILIKLQHDVTMSNRRACLTLLAREYRFVRSFKKLFHVDNVNTSANKSAL